MRVSIAPGEIGARIKVANVDRSSESRIDFIVATTEGVPPTPDVPEIVTRLRFVADKIEALAK